MGAIQTTSSVSDTSAQLKQRLPIQSGQRYLFALENDLIGRAALAVLWPHRSQLDIYLLADDPHDRNIVALRSALTTVSTPPAVAVVSASAANELAATESPLVWAVDHERTSPETQALLQQRTHEMTFTPYAAPFSALSGRRPNQTDPTHELILRDIIHEHASFLNFFGDRFDPRDLYERSKYPSWFQPQQDFTGAIPPLVYSTVDADGAIVETEKFTGSLQLATEYVRPNHRVQIDLAPLLENLDESSFDMTLQLQNQYANPSGAGALSLEVHYGDELYAQFDLATSAPDLQVPISSIHRGDALTIVVRASRDNPRPSWSIASRTFVRVAVHPAGTHPAPSLLTRTKSWLQRLARRRQGRG